MILFIIVGAIALVFGIASIPRQKQTRRPGAFERQMERAEREQL